MFVSLPQLRQRVLLKLMQTTNSYGDSLRICSLCFWPCQWLDLFQVFILGQLGILLECQVHVKILSVGELARAIHSFAQRGCLPYQRPTGGLPLPLRPPEPRLVASHLQGVEPHPRACCVWSRSSVWLIEAEMKLLFSQRFVWCQRMEIFLVLFFFVFFFLVGHLSHLQ